MFMPALLGRMWCDVVGLGKADYELVWFVFRINDMHPKTRKILQLLRLKQVQFASPKYSGVEWRCLIWILSDRCAPESWSHEGIVFIAFTSHELQRNEFYAAVTQCVFVNVNQTFNGVFMKANTATLSMLRKVEPYVTYG